MASVRDGSVEFGITGLDTLEEKRGAGDEILILHDDLKFGGCSLELAVPEEWQDVQDVASLTANQNHVELLAYCHKFPAITARYMETWTSIVI